MPQAVACEWLQEITRRELEREPKTLFVAAGMGSCGRRFEEVWAGLWEIGRESGRIDERVKGELLL